MVAPSEPPTSSASPASTGAGPTTRLLVLDSLRGIAALSVVLFHLTTDFDSEAFFPGYPKAIYSFSAGRYGVQLFFVISGFVILWTIGRAARLRDFAIGRFARLYPPFWASMILVAVWVEVSGARTLGATRPFDFTVTEFLASITMVPQWLGSKPIDGVYWTLTIEMGFYLLISAMFLTKLLRRDRVVWTLAIFWFVDIVVGSAVVKASGASLHNVNDYAYLFLAGMACFLLWEGVAQPRWLLWVLFLQPPFVDILRSNFVPAVIDVAIIALLHLAVTQRASILERKPFVFLGTISYSLYLVHATVGYLTLRWLLEHHVERNLAVLLTVGVAIGLAVVLNRVVERRISPWVRSAMSRS